MAAWKPVLSNSINFGVMLKTLPTKGKMAWEYNPLRNYRLSSLNLNIKALIIMSMTYIRNSIFSFRQPYL